MSGLVEHLLLYGTLGRTEPGHAALGLDRALAFVGERTVIDADLHDLGDYPGLVDGTGGVQAELFRILAPAILETLDRHEGWDERRPGSALFRRVRRRVAGAAGHVDAWLYVYTRPVGGAPLIPHGSWARWRASRATPRSR